MFGTAYRAAKFLEEEELGFSLFYLFQAPIVRNEVDWEVHVKLKGIPAKITLGWI